VDGQAGTDPRGVPVSYTLSRPPKFRIAYFGDKAESVNYAYKRENSPYMNVAYSSKNLIQQVF